jgi:hypothetical protein
MTLTHIAINAAQLDLAYFSQISPTEDGFASAEAREELPLRHESVS